MKNKNGSLLQAKILGRVERIMGSNCNVNPFPAESPQWYAFREGWLRELDDPISQDCGTQDREQLAENNKPMQKRMSAKQL
jgi:hypothetical protein